jgi:hypothetical protein
MIFKAPFATLLKVVFAVLALSFGTYAFAEMPNETAGTSADAGATATQSGKNKTRRIVMDPVGSTETPQATETPRATKRVAGNKRRVAKKSRRSSRSSRRRNR